MKMGARGLRSIVEKVMLDIMYKIPSMKGVRECLINKAVVENNLEPILFYEQEVKSA